MNQNELSWQDFLIHLIFIMIALILVSFIYTRFAYGPKPIREKRERIESALSEYIYTGQEDWCIKIQLDEADELLDLLEEQQEKIDEYEWYIDELTNEIEELKEELNSY